MQRHVAVALLALGATAFAQKAPARWGRRSDGLDTLTIDYDGYYTGLSSFLGTFSDWESSPIDGNMFLESVDNDDHRQYPTVSARYIGCRNGSLPAGKTTRDVSLQSASYSNSDGTLKIDIMALCPTATFAKINSSDSQPTAPAVSGDVKAIWAKIVVGGEYSGTYPTTLQGALAYFNQVEVVTGGSDELVTDRYFGTHTTKSVVLQSIGS